MAGELRTIRKRIRSVENTRKITRAMEMIATSKLHRYQSIILKNRAYTNELEVLLKRVVRSKYLSTHAFLRVKEEKRIGLVLMTSDTGLCGSYNYELVDNAHEFLSSISEKPFLIGVGRKGVHALTGDGLNFRRTFMGIRTSQIEETIAELSKTIQQAFLEEEVDAVYVTYGHCLTLSSHHPVTEKLLPLQDVPASAAQLDPFEEKRYIYEPSPEVVFQKLVTLLFEARVRQIFLEAFISEQIARITAMRQATDNAAEMFDSLILQRNKARQAAITGEIIEVISGSQALKE